MRSLAVLVITTLLPLLGCGGGEPTTPAESNASAATPRVGCGDGICQVALDEGCTSCPEDCNTLEAVCGNGACDTGEDSDSCVADCGPSPWPVAWDVTAEDVFERINDQRQAGGTCPDGTVYGPTSALEWDEEAWRAARLHSWDLSFDDYFEHDSCNGRSPGDRLVDMGGTGFAAENLAAGQTSATEVVQGWMRSNGHCHGLFTAASGGAVGVAEQPGDIRYFTFVATR